jgi:hypothetical protein
MELGVKPPPIFFSRHRFQELAWAHSCPERIRRHVRSSIIPAFEAIAVTVSLQIAAGNPADAPETPPHGIARSPERRAQPRPGAILGRSMRRQSSWLRCLRRRRSDDPDDGAEGDHFRSGGAGADVGEGAASGCDGAQYCCVELPKQIVCYLPHATYLR